MNSVSCDPQTPLPTFDRKSPDEIPLIPTESTLIESHLESLTTAPFPIFWNDKQNFGNLLFPWIPFPMPFQFQFQSQTPLLPNCTPNRQSRQSPIIPLFPPLLEPRWTVVVPYKKQFSQMTKVEGEYKQFILQFIKYPQDFEMVRDTAVRQIKERVEVMTGNSVPLIDIRKTMSELRRKKQQHFREFNRHLFESLDWDFEAVLKHNL